MSTQLSEFGSAFSLLKAQDADLAIAHELMRGRTSLEKIFIAGLRGLVDKYKPQPEEENREYTRVLITTLEQEIEALSAPKPDVPEHLSIDEKALTEGTPLVQHLRETHKAHEDAYAAVLASKDELKRWKDSTSVNWKAVRMPLVELEYRWSIHHQRQSAQTLRKWYETELSPLLESHHSALEDTKMRMMWTINANIDCASTCSRIYSRALENASGLLPLDHRASIEEKLEAETNSYALRPVDYCNWFYNGQPSPLLFGIGTMVIDPKIVANYRGSYWLDREERLILLKAEREEELQDYGAWDVTRFELTQYAPLLPLNSSELERFKSAKIISRRDLPALLSPDESAWDPLGSKRRKELLKMVIAANSDRSTLRHSNLPRWLTFRSEAEDIVDVLRRKWDFDNDRPKPRE